MLGTSENMASHPPKIVSKHIHMERTTRQSILVHLRPILISNLPEPLATQVLEAVPAAEDAGRGSASFEGTCSQGRSLKKTCCSA